MRPMLCTLTLLILLASGAAALETPWERDPDSTPRYAETVAWCRQLALQSDQVEFTTFGTSPQGRDLPLVIWDRDGLLTAEECRSAGRTVLMVQACIHAGESCGKDAGMGWIRDLAQDGPEGITVLFVPIFNVDGHERFGPYNRINQNGPREMGWRVTAQNLNLNRDYIKADTPEMAAWLRLWTAWQPHFFVDIHSTDGADYQYPLTYGLELWGNLEPGLTGWLEEYLAAAEKHMDAAGFPIAPYVGFRERHDPRSGLRSWVAGPRFSQGYAAVRNRPGLLIETHMLKPYSVRVRSARAMLDATLSHLAADRHGLMELTTAADAASASAAFRAEPFPLRWEQTDLSERTTFLGVAYEKVESELSGGAYMKFDADSPESFEVDHYAQPRPSVFADLPEAYLIPPEWDLVIARLELHGVRVMRLTEPVELTVGGWRLQDPQWRSQPYEGRHPLTFELEDLERTRVYPAGTVVVDLAQAAAPVIAHALDPRGPDSFLSWGFFDAALTRVEYVEDYVIEPMMTEMVAADPGLLDELEAAKAADPEFAANPWAIRYWFYARTPYYDEQAFVYPVGRVDDRDVLRALPVR